jgi:hypothetical protein
LKEGCKVLLCPIKNTNLIMYRIAFFLDGGSISERKNIFPSFPLDFQGRNKTTTTDEDKSPKQAPPTSQAAEGRQSLTPEAP